MRRRTGSWWNGKGAGLRLPILAALSMLILVTLLSALAPLGPPSSRATGSAFNPATAEVVLKARAQTPSQLAEAPRPDGDGAPPLMLAVGLAVALLLLRHIRPIGPATGHRDDIRAFAPARTRRARAPPFTA